MPKRQFNATEQNSLLQNFWQSTTEHQLSTNAETHGLGPLLYTRLKATDTPLPSTPTRHLKALYLRHRHAAQVRSRVLTEILTAYQEAGLQVLLLKGAALAHLIYPEPGLRPMRDVDLLVPPSEARRAQAILAELGFSAPLPPVDLPSKHLEAATRRTDGLTISVEVHHNLFSDSLPPASMTLADLTGEPLPVPVGDLTAYTLGYEDMLWHLCRHAVHIHQPLRLIWVADIVGFAEQFATEIDWAAIRRHYGFVLDVLAAFHFLTPLSDTLRQQAGLTIGSEPQGIGVDFQGWPRYSLQEQPQKGSWQLWRETFFPSAWWLRLNYGVNNNLSLFWCRWVGHPYHVLGWAAHLLQERVGHQTARFPNKQSG